MKIRTTKLPGLLKIEREGFRDNRGIYVMNYSEREYRAHGIRVHFVEDDYSRSKKNVLRGIHADTKAWKLISCPVGEIYVVIVNCDTKSKFFGKWVGFTLSGDNHIQLLVPPKHGVSHLVRSDTAVFLYKQSGYYDPKRQATRSEERRVGKESRSRWSPYH